MWSMGHNQQPLWNLHLAVTTAQQPFQLRPTSHQHSAASCLLHHLHNQQ
jgi:hypothetical protein